MMAPEYFHLYSNCVPVKGALNAIICDLQRRRYLPIPIGLWYILEATGSLNLTQLKEKFHQIPSFLIEDHLKMLESEDYGYFSTHSQGPAKMDLSWDHPSKITNAIIDFNDSTQHDFLKLIQELEQLGCKDIQIRCFSPRKPNFFTDLLQSIENTKIRSVEILTPFLEEHNQSEWLNLISDFPRIRSIGLHSAPNSHKDISQNFGGMGILFHIPQKIENSSFCGVVSQAWFTLNVASFSEAVNHNSCLNRKIGIDSEGMISNCPSMPSKFGHHKQISLAEVVNQKGFQAIWDLTKDQIAVCQDCEFRYICMDCRAYTQNDANGKPAKCSYDPYSGKWGKS